MATIPDTMTGGVDLTGTVDFKDGQPEHLAHLNAQPDVLQTMTGGHGPLAGSVHLEVGGDYSDHESAEVRKGFAEVKTQYDGHPVRVVPASRFRTSRITLAAGASYIIAQADARRTRLSISILDADGAVNLAYVGNDVATTASMGFALSTNTGGPCDIVLTHGDSVAIAADSTNLSSLTVSVAFEIAE